MNENELNVNEIVKVESLGVIKQQLDKVETFIDEKTKDIPKVLEQLEDMTDEEREEKKGEIKKYKQYLSKIETELENKRKEIKKEINKPYEEFNEYYSNGAKTKLDENIAKLDKVVKDIEYTQLRDKEIELIEFANQHIQANNLSEIIGFEDIGLNITLSASIKSLKEQVLAFINQVVKTIALINLDEYSDELMLEYKNCFDYFKAKEIVTNRHKQLEELKKQQEEKLEQEKQEEKVVEKVDSALFVLNEDNGKYESVNEVTTPKELIEDGEIITVSFTITDTKEKILKLRDYLKENEINYE